jgi:hypothetical protein
MKNLTSMLSFATVVLVGSVGESFALPPCPFDSSQRHHNCFGTYTFANGEKYVGEFKNGDKNGQGTYTFAKSGNKYAGGYKYGKRHGQGTFIFANGNKYVGDYKDGKKNGQGTFTFEDGRTTKGTWKNNEFQYAQKGPQTVIFEKPLLPSSNNDEIE